MVTITVNPGDSIQTAINNLPIEGGIVELANGTHTINNPIYITKSNIIIHGTQNSILNHTNATSGIFYVPSDWVVSNPVPPKISNITFDGFKITSTYTWTNGDLYLITVFNADNITVKNITSNANMYGFFGNNYIQDGRVRSNTLLFDNLYISNGSLLFAFSTNIIVRNSTFVGYGRQSSIDSNRDNDGVEIYNNYVSSESSGNDGAIKLYASTNQNCHHNIIVKGMHGITLWSSLTNTNVSNNIITGTRLTGIQINPQGALNGIIINNNIIYNLNTTSPNTPIGISIENYGYSVPSNPNWSATIINNVIYKAYTGIKHISPLIDITTKNNIITNNIDYGIIITSGIANNGTPLSGGKSLVSNYDNVWSNPLGNYSGPRITQNNGISLDSLFVDATNKDFHLKSQYGHWNGTAWVNDTVTSPCINAGDPTSINTLSPWGGIIEMGAYGNTIESSNNQLTCPIPICEFNITQI